MAQCRERSVKQPEQQQRDVHDGDAHLALVQQACDRDVPAQPPQGYGCPNRRCTPALTDDTCVACPRCHIGNSRGTELPCARKLELPAIAGAATQAHFKRHLKQHFKQRSCIRCDVLTLCSTLRRPVSMRGAPRRSTCTGKSQMHDRP
jgi:hypothetical protein